MRATSGSWRRWPSCARRWRARGRSPASCTPSSRSRRAMRRLPPRSTRSAAAASGHSERRSSGRAVSRRDRAGDLAHEPGSRAGRRRSRRPRAREAEGPRHDPPHRRRRRGRRAKRRGGRRRARSRRRTRHGRPRRRVDGAHRLGGAAADAAKPVVAAAQQRLGAEGAVAGLAQTVAARPRREPGPVAAARTARVARAAREP